MYRCIDYRCIQALIQPRLIHNAKESTILYNQTQPGTLICDPTNRSSLSLADDFDDTLVLEVSNNLGKLVDIYGNGGLLLDGFDGRLPLQALSSTSVKECEDLGCRDILVPGMKEARNVDRRLTSRLRSPRNFLCC